MEDFSFQHYLRLVRTSCSSRSSGSTHPLLELVSIYMNMYINNGNKFFFQKDNEPSLGYKKALWKNNRKQERTLIKKGQRGMKKRRDGEWRESERKVREEEENKEERKTCHGNISHIVNMTFIFKLIFSLSAFIYFWQLSRMFLYQINTWTLNMHLAIGYSRNIFTSVETNTLRQNKALYLPNCVQHLLVCIFYSWILKIHFY